MHRVEGGLQEFVSSPKNSKPWGVGRANRGLPFRYSFFLRNLGFLISTFILMTHFFRMLEPSSWGGPQRQSLLMSAGSG